MTKKDIILALMAGRTELSQLNRKVKIGKATDARIKTRTHKILNNLDSLINAGAKQVRDDEKKGEHSIIEEILSGGNQK